MIGIVTALQIEGQKIINYFQLKKIVTENLFPIFTNKEKSIYLTISGVGKLNSSLASLNLTNKFDIHSIFNIGTCAGSKDKKIGSLFLINKIIDSSFNKEYFPDILFEHNLIEQSIKTVDIPANTEENILVDMEASGFFHSASKVLSLENIHILKIISDHFDDSFFDKEAILNIFEQNMDQIAKYINNVSFKFSNPSFTNKELERISDFFINYNFTDYQKQYFLSKLKALKVFKLDFNFLDTYKNEINNKTDLNKFFNLVIEKCNQLIKEQND